MPRSLWSGAISFGMVNIPVSLVTAVRKKSVRFREIRREDASRVRHKKVAAADDKEVERDELAKGYEITPDQYVILEPEELAALEPKASRTIDIEQFVELADVDPLYFEQAYYLVPGETAAKPYRLLHEAMTASGKAGIARFVLRSRQHLALIRPLGEALAISMLVYADEVILPEQLKEDLPSDDVELKPKEIDMATDLIESMAEPWEPEAFRDTYRDKVLELIERKAEGEEIATVPDTERESGEVVDLMEALQASLQKAKGAQADGDTDEAEEDTEAEGGTKRKKSA